VLHTGVSWSLLELSLLVLHLSRRRPGAALSVLLLLLVLLLAWQVLVEGLQPLVPSTCTCACWCH
jgi:small neutral amino acid transporter SnatA (MarC family)